MYEESAALETVACGAWRECLPRRTYPPGVRE